MFTRKKIAVIAAIALPIIGTATVSSAQEGGVPSCGQHEQVVAFPNVGPDAGSVATIVVGHSHYPRSLTVAASIPAGEYDVITGAYDGYKDRTSTETQDFERFILRFLDADGSVIASTSPSMDLVDGVEEASWTGPVGTVTLDRAAVSVEAEHADLGDQAVFDIGQAQSVQPSCFGLDTVPPTTTTTLPPTTTVPDTTTTTVPDTTTTVAPTTTVPDTTTTTVAPTTTVIEPPTTTVAPTTTVIEPPTTVAPTTTVIEPPTTVAPTTTVAVTTTTVPTQVLPTVQENPDPDPVVGDPTFTG
jgi:hypothetical protein